MSYELASTYHAIEEEWSGTWTRRAISSPGVSFDISYTKGSQRFHAVFEGTITIDSQGGVNLHGVRHSTDRGGEYRAKMRAGGVFEGQFQSGSSRAVHFQLTPAG